MAYTAPTTRATDDLITATIWNTELVGNIADLHDRLTSATVLQDVKTSGTGGGTSINGVNTRDLNTKTGDVAGNVTLAANQFTLVAGKWVMWAYSTFSEEPDAVKLRLYNDSDSTVVAEGSTQSRAATSTKNYQIQMFAYVDISASKTFELQQLQDQSASNGLGNATSQGENEIYTQVILIKVG